jgi:hypothetical protein
MQRKQFVANAIIQIGVFFSFWNIQWKSMLSLIVQFHFFLKTFMNLGTFKTFIELESILSFLRLDAWYEVNSIKENWNYI